VRIGGKVCKAIIADSFIKRAIGLMFRKGIDSDTCMLFVSGRDSMQGITMQNMLFPIDVIWLDRDLNIVGMAEDLKPDRGFTFSSYKPHGRSRYVIELKSGFIRQNRIRENSLVKIEKKNRK
jgi:hypothetical protein